MKLYIVLLLTLLCVACGGNSPHAVTPAASAWDLTYSSGVPDHLQPSAGAIGAFAFPQDGHVNYLTTPFSSATAPSQVSMTFKVVTSGPIVFNSVDTSYGYAPGVTLMIQRRGDDYRTEFSRWWANAARVELKETDAVTVTVPLVLANWGSVGVISSGLTDADRQRGFNDAIANLGHVGMTFGGGCCAGHGLFVSGGTAQFVLIDYTVN